MKIVLGGSKLNIFLGILKVCKNYFPQVSFFKEKVKK